MAYGWLGYTHGVITIETICDILCVSRTRNQVSHHHDT